MPSPCFLNKYTNIPKLLCCKQPSLPPRNHGSSTLYRAWLTCEHHLFSRAKKQETLPSAFLFQLELFATQKPRLFDSVRHVHLKCADRNLPSEAPEHTTSWSRRRACLVVRPEISTACACDAQDLLCSHINICVKLFSLNMPQFYLFNLEHRAMQPYLISLKYPNNIRKLDPNL